MECDQTRREALAAAVGGLTVFGAALPQLVAGGEEKAGPKAAAKASVRDRDPKLDPLSKSFDAAAFRTKHVTRSGDPLPSEPEPGIEYTVPANGVVVLTATCFHEDNENGLSIFGLAFEPSDGPLFAFGAASVQVNPGRGIDIFENTASIPVTAGGTFLYLGGQLGRTVYAQYRSH